MFLWTYSTEPHVDSFIHLTQPLIENVSNSTNLKEEQLSKFQKFSAFLAVFYIKTYSGSEKMRHSI